jgi:hypothetical protein
MTTLSSTPGSVPELQLLTVFQSPVPPIQLMVAADAENMEATKTTTSALTHDLFDIIENIQGFYRANRLSDPLRMIRFGVRRSFKQFSRTEFLPSSSARKLRVGDEVP